MSEVIINAEKEKYGTGAAIKINKSKEKLSDTPWGDVDKTELRNKVLEASNYKELVKDVYMVVEEGWEESPSTKLKYPVMEIKDGEAFYNRHGLSSALGYAKAEGNTDVVDKIERIYKDLEINEERKETHSMDNVIENKLDKDNKDIEEIRDDAEAQEDDAKEELKEAACDKAKEEVIENEIEPDDEGEEGLKDDVDADKDYWRKKAEENAAQLEELNKRIMALEREKELTCMGEMLKEYQICLAEEDFKCFEKDMKKLSKDQFSAKLFEHIAKKTKEERLNREPAMFSYMPAFNGVEIKDGITLEKLSNKY